MPDLTNEELKKLWAMRGVTEFKCKLIYIKNKRTIRCSKCDAKEIIPCPIPDPITESDADIAEEIRVWMEKADSIERIGYGKNLRVMWIKTDYENSFECWKLFHATPSDKIRSFFELEIK